MTRAPCRGAVGPRPLLVVLGLVLGLAGLARAQEQTTPDVPAGPARVEGRLVHTSRPDAVSGVEVLLYALGSDGSAGLRSAKTDAQGHFAFEGVSNDPGVVYLLGARQGEVPFGKRFTFGAGELEHTVELRLSDPVSDAANARRGPVEVRIDRGCTHLRVRQIHAIDNTGKEVVFVPPERRDELPPLLEVSIPPDAEGFESMIGHDGLSVEGGRVRYWGPLYPGSQEVQFGYGLPLDTATVSLGFPGGVPQLRVLAPDSVVSVSGAGLEPAGTQSVDGARYATLRGGPLESARLDVSVLEAPETASLETPHAELWTELDDAALEVNEQLEVVADEPLDASPGRPWMCLPLPENAEALRFSPATLRAGLRRDPSGALAIHGPLPKGGTALAMSYRLPAGPDGAVLRLSYDRPLPLLHVLVADTGVVAKTDRMHRRQMVRTDDRLYQHYEAFAIDPGEVVKIDLQRTPPYGTGSRWATTGFVALAAAAALAFLSAPLRQSRPEPETVSDETSPFAVEREAIRRSLADLDEDLETGKLSAEDHAAMRDELRARAAKLLVAEREAPRRAERGRDEAAGAPPEAAAAPGNPKFCSACGVPVRPGDRFCSQCGAELQRTPGAS